MGARYTRENPPPGIKLRQLKRPMTKDGRKVTEVFDVVVTLPRDNRGRYPKKWVRGFTTLADAIKAREDLQVESRAGRAVLPGKTTVADFLTDWIARIEPPATTLKRSTWLSYESHIRIHLRPRLGSVRLNRLTTTDVRRAYSDMLRAGVSAATVRRIHATLHRALADAVEEHQLSVNPASVPHKKLPKAERYDYTTWDGRELSAFLTSVIDDRLFAAFHVAAFTAMRRGELLALRWRDIDLDAGMMSVHRAMLSLHHSIEITDVKSSHGVRVVELDSETVSVLREHRKRQVQEMLDAEGVWRDTEGLVFTQADGAIVHPDWFSKAFRERAKAAGLRPIRLHDLRHGWASIAGQQGVPLRVIQERLGHHDPAFTARQYQHVLPGMGKAGAEKFASAIRTATESGVAES